MKIRIPFTNFRDQYSSIKKEVEVAIDNALISFQYLKGKEVKLFESMYSKLLKITHCVSTANGTDALYISLKALGIARGDEVICPAWSWISSSETITPCGATPVFVDVDPETYTLDANLIKQKITPRTKAIIAVHLYGQAADLRAIRAISHKYQLFLIEDCAQAHLTEYEKQYVGTFGDAGAFSFYPTKNLGAYGDAGAIITANDALAEKMRRFANHGALEKDDHLFEGTNSRMDTIQAAVLLAKLPYLKQWNEKRILNASVYTRHLKAVDEITTPYVNPNTKHTFHLYVIRAKKRDALQEYLLENGVQTLVHYPKALPNIPAYQYLGHRREEFPVSSILENEVLSLPIYPELTEEEIVYVSTKIKEFYTKH